MFLCTFAQAESCYKEGMSLDQLAKCANQGDAIAQNNLGFMYYEGNSLPRDYKKAVEWYSKAAEQAYAGAQYNLGVMYENGEGVAQDEKKAFELYSKAAEQGNAYAQLNLGAMYFNNKVVSQDLVLAYMWNHLAAAQHDEDAIKNRDILTKQMTSEQITKAQQMSTDWLAKHLQKRMKSMQ